MCRPVVLIALLSAALGCRAATPSEILWNELAALTVGHEVTIPLNDGATVRGEVLSVRKHDLLIDVARTSDSRRYPKGEVALPRTAFREVHLYERHGNGGRVLGSVVGALVGIVAGAEIAAHGTNTEAAAVPTFTGTAVASTVFGYYVGRSMDRRTRVLRISDAPDVATLLEDKAR